MPVWIARTRRRDRDLRSHRLHERLGRGGPAAVMGDLEEIEPRQPRGEEARVDVLLDIAREQETVLPDRAEQHDRDVVDARPAVRRLSRDLAADRPEDA
jgi:hypothetical protein